MAASRDTSKLGSKASKTLSRALPDNYKPSLATLVASPPEGDQWVHEIKYDGYRIGCRIDRGKITLLTRNENDWTEAFSEIVEAAKAMKIDRGLIDGEACVVLPDGRTSFQALQEALKRVGTRHIEYFVFDVLHLNGRDLTTVPLTERKSVLEQALRKSKSRVIRLSEHLDGAGKDVFREACRLGLEGIVSKRRDSLYEHGRTRAWLKTKCLKRQEFVIGGFTDPDGSRVGLGALLVGVYDNNHLRYAGKVGTGFTASVLTELRKMLDRLEQSECPFTPKPAGSLGGQVHWVKPELVGEVAFTEWTNDGKIRHPSFQGLRKDKPAIEVRKEGPVDVNLAEKDAASSVAAMKGHGRDRPSFGSAN